MILKEATKEAFGYWPSELTPKNGKQILVACEFCGEFRVTTKRIYHTFCRSCSNRLGGNHKGNTNALGYKHTDDAKSRISKSMMGKKNSLGIIPNKETRCKLSAVHKDKPLTEEHKANISAALRGRIVTEAEKAKISGENNHNWKPKVKRSCLQCGKVFQILESAIKRGEGKYCCKKCFDKAQFTCGRKISCRRHTAKRKRQLGYTLLLPVAEGEVGHHVTNECVVGIPKEIHVKFGGYARKRHRAKVLEWLKLNDKKKYEIVLSILDE